MMRFTIVTPSFRDARWLKLCIASVDDQEVAHEHIVQDAASDDGTLEWLPHDARVRAFVEKDSGMYDAVNRGWRRAQGEFLAYLNCDEQYLPGALRKVSDYFDRHPEVDVVFGDVIVVDARGRYLCERRALIPQRPHTQAGSNLSYLTAAAFVRRRILDQHGLYFDARLRDLGDCEWTLTLLRAGMRMATLGQFTSVFTETGRNMNLGPNAARERQEYWQRAPRWVRRAAPLLDLHFRLRRLLAGHYHCTPHDYAIYTEDSPERRQRFRVDRPTFRWIRPWTALPSPAPVRFTIVTPSFRSSRWLKLCIASVADQGVTHEHIVQDAGSDDGTLEWLPHDHRVKTFIEKDEGMYDAVSRGWRRGRGEFLAYLNCDEQYLPGALRAVADFFDRHPEVDVVFGDAVVVNEKGGYVCDRRPVTPRVAHSLVSGNLSFLTAATFIRRSLVERHQLYFEPGWRVAGDCEWAVRLVRCGARMACLRRRLSTFTETGQNLAGGGARHREELRNLFESAPRWMQLAAPLVVAHYRLRRLFQGAYFCRPHEYPIYTLESPAERRLFRVEHPTFRWRRAPAAAPAPSQARTP